VVNLNWGEGGGGCTRSMQLQLGMLGTVSAFAWRHRKTEKICVSITWLRFITEKECAYYAVRTGYFYKQHITFCPQVSKANQITYVAEVSLQTRSNGEPHRWVQQQLFGAVRKSFLLPYFCLETRWHWIWNWVVLVDYVEHLHSSAHIPIKLNRGGGGGGLGGI